MCPVPPKSMYRSGLMPANRSSNRYGNILPLQRNRVMLKTQDAEGDYINASFVKGDHYTYITTGMPMSNTVSDFWAMIYDYHPSCIVMMNDENEDESCEQYWPDEGSRQYGSFTVSTLSITRKNDVIVRNLRVRHGQSSKSHELKQYQFLGWSKDTLYEVGGASSLLTLIDQVQESIDPEGYFLVHCLSGVGRTGVFCTAMESIAQISEADIIDIFQTVKMLRVDRTHFIQTEEDYAFVYTVILDYLHKHEYEQVHVDIHDVATYDNQPDQNNEYPYSSAGAGGERMEHVYGNTAHPYDNTEHTYDDNTEHPYESTEDQYDSTKHPTGSATVRGNLSGEQVDANTESLLTPPSQTTESVYENLAFDNA